MTEFKNDNDVFAPSNTGTKAHAFLGSRGAKDGNLRAACRVTIQRSVSSTFISLDRARTFYSVCENCVKLFLEAEARAEASMQPATEAADLGYVAPVKQCTCECDWTCDRPADEPCTCPCTCGTEAPQVVTVDDRTVSFESKAPGVPARTMGEYLAARRTAQPQHADLSTEDGTVTLKRDTLTRRGHWADVALATGRRYSVSMLVHRKTDDQVLVDYVIYWSERDGRSRGPIRTASENDKPGSVGGRIWALLTAANIA